jgi:hypothetical protein
MLLLDVKTEKLKLQNQIDDWFDKMQMYLDQRPKDTKGQIQHLAIIRKEVYEDLNQLQHKALILEVAERLQEEFSVINTWTWHPMQTSHIDFADLTGYVDKEVFLNAEITTSLSPLGTIDTRMHSTLMSLNKKKGKKYYFVQTDKMLKRAKSKIKNNELNIEAHKIESVTL